ncbi:ABC transporter ATP-binding protein [Vagococcus acidifermentans]|uniref:ABC transporter ATP-binding protein n=1 Tax=Vagococcus acidifermentans TaxID=564710 RepID=A0A430AXS3_9ENTE|nr:ATP-binding cassette domain-containing protein [Vagococcus acidifermentans]RSU12848.1 ABC transporter ATP-binding protein [Vagococcus acidifermentans]
MSQILELKAVHKGFDLGTVNENKVLTDLNLSLNKHDFVTVIGGNGAGKSTLMNIIAGSLFADDGEIWLNGKNITKWNVPKRSAFIGRVFQDPRMGTATRLSVEENLALAYKRGEKRGLEKSVPKKKLPFFKEQLAKLDMDLENRLKTEVGRLSGGQRQALTLLMATIQTPHLLLLDEHTAALDPKISRLVLQLTEELIEEKQLTALMITHNMEDAITYGNRLIMLHHGNIVVDVSGEEKQQLTVPQLINLFQESSHEQLTEDSLVLG